MSRQRAAGDWKNNLCEINLHGSRTATTFAHIFNIHSFQKLFFIHLIFSLFLIVVIVGE